MPVGAAIATVGATAVTGIASANAQKKAAQSAANAQVQASTDANATQLAIYNDQRNLLQPAAIAGADAQAHQMLMLGYTPAQVRQYLQSTSAAFNAPTSATPAEEATGSHFDPDTHRWVSNPPMTSHAAPNPTGGADTAWVDSYDPQSFLESTPGYQFRLGQGTQAIDRSAAARGRLFSGATGMAQQRYGQDYASGEWGHLFDQFGRLAGQGQDATGTVVNVADQYGDAVSDNLRAAGNERASIYLRAGQAQGDVYSALAGGIGGIYGLGSKTPGWWG